MPPSPPPPASRRRRRPSPSVSVVIAVHDAGGLPVMLRGLPAVDEVIVVVDGPPGPATAAVRAACPDALVIRPGRRGAGNALASGLAASSCDVAVTLSGDGATDPREIPRFVAALTGGADVALGSRYRDGGRDLTGGRFRRCLDLMLIRLVNALFGSRRTDPGFGYAAFWRDALDRLDLPDPSGRHAAAWGDGPEIGPLLAIRPEARGMRVAEVGSIAYPRMRRPARAERARLRDWIRVMAREYAQRSTQQSARLPGRHTAAAAAGEALVAPLRPGRNALTPLRPGHLALTPPRPGHTALTPPRPGHNALTPPRPGHAASVPAATSTADLAAPAWARADRPARPEPIWGPPRRRPQPAGDLWREGENPAPHVSARPAENAGPRSWRTGYPAPAGGPDLKARSADDHRPGPAAARPAPPQPREVGGERRRLEGFQRPDLRLINGEGAGGHRTRSGRLRPVRNDPG